MEKSQVPYFVAKNFLIFFQILSWNVEWAHESISSER